MPPTIVQHIDKLKALCQQFGVQKMYAFGSVLTPQFNTDKSDLDFIAEMQPMPPLERGENLMQLWDALESLFERRVDLLTDQPIQNPYLRKSIENTKQLIYERAC